MIPTLEFIELDDYLAHLRQELDTDWTHLEIGHKTSEPDTHGIRGVTFVAIATRRILTPAPYLLAWSCPLLNTTTVHLQLEQHEPPEQRTRSQLHANFEKVKGMLHEHGINIRSGKWLPQPPDYLR